MKSGGTGVSKMGLSNQPAPSQEKTDEPLPTFQTRAGMGFQMSGPPGSSHDNNFGSYQLNLSSGLDFMPWPLFGFGRWGFTAELGGGIDFVNVRRFVPPRDNALRTNHGDTFEQISTATALLSAGGGVAVMPERSVVGYPVKVAIQRGTGGFSSWTLSLPQFCVSPVSGSPRMYTCVEWGTRSVSAEGITAFGWMLGSTGYFSW